MDPITDLVYTKVLILDMTYSVSIHLASIDFTTMTATVIGEFPGPIASLTTDCEGNLYALTTQFLNNATHGLRPASVYLVDKETVDMEFIIARPCLGGTIFFQEFSYNWQDGLFYRLWDEALSGRYTLFEAFSLDGRVNKRIQIEENVLDDAQVLAMEYIGEGVFGISVNDGYVGFITTDGDVFENEFFPGFSAPVFGMTMTVQDPESGIFCAAYASECTFTTTTTETPEYASKQVRMNYKKHGQSDLDAVCNGEYLYG